MVEKIFEEATCTECFGDAIENAETKVVYCSLCNIDIFPDGTFVSRKEVEGASDQIILHL